MNGTSGDVFSEFLVKKNMTGKNYGLIVLSCIAALFLSAAIFLFVPSLSIIILLLWFGVYFVVRMQKIEYEYTFTSGDLDIDQLTGDFRRKRRMSIKSDTVLMVAPEKSEYLLEYKNGNYKEYDFSRHDPQSTGRYVIVGQFKSEPVRVIFEPNEKMLNNMWKYYPSKVKRV